MTLRAFMVIGLGLATGLSHAGVKSLTSDEMVDTYVKDSAIIVVPKKKEAVDEEKARSVRSITIAPGEAPVSPAEAQQVVDKSRESGEAQVSNSLASAEEQFIKASLALPATDGLAQTPPELAPLPPPNFSGQPIEIPDAPFSISEFNNQLGLSSNGEQLTFSIGQPPGVDGIEVPYAINEGPVQLTPRPGGGFDLVIDIPKN